MSWRSYLAILIYLISDLGCVTIWRFREMEAKVANLEKQKAEIEEEQRRDKEKMQRLYQEMNEATETLRKGGATLVADVDTLKTEITRMKGIDDEIYYKLSKIQEDIEMIKKSLDEKLGIALIQMPKGLPEDKDTLYNAGKSSLEKGDMLQTRGILRKFLDTYPDDPRAGEAQFIIGESYFREGKYGQAIKEFQRVHDRYRDVKGAPVERALFRIGESLLKQGDCKKAQGVFRYLMEYNRKAPEADKAKLLLQNLKKSCK